MTRALIVHAGLKVLIFYVPKDIFYLDEAQLRNWPIFYALFISINIY